MKTLSRLVLWFIITLYSFAFSGCSQPLISVDSSNNTMNVGSKSKPERTINFRSTRLR